MLSPAIHGLNDELAISQLASIKWKSNLRGLTQIESKDDLKKRGIGSPDRAEAVMLAFADRTPTESPPFSRRFSGSLRKYRKYRACWRVVFDRRAPERIRFGPRQLILCSFSPSRIEPVPLRIFHTFSLPQVIKIVEAVLPRTFAV